MKATAQIKELHSDRCKLTIIRNLSRIMDLRIMDIDLENNTITFLYDNISALDKAKRELMNIGFSVLSCKCQESNKGVETVAYEERLMNR